MTGANRWRHRFQDFEKAFLLLERSLTIESPTEVERGGIIHFYEMAFELAWKLMKDYLERQGFAVNSPRDAIKQAFNATILDDDQLWYASLEDRSLRTLTYDETKAIDVVAKIRSHYFQNYSNYMRICELSCNGGMRYLCLVAKECEGNQSVSALN